MRVLSATLLSFFVLAAPALADNPLLSGYSGPGGVDQTLLGGGLVGGSGGNSGGTGGGGRSLRAPAIAPGARGTLADVSSAPRLARTPRRTVTTATPAGAAKRSAKQRTPTSSADPGSSSSSASGTVATGAPAAAPSASTDGGSGFPISAADLLLLLLGAALLVGVARATARLGDPAVPGT